MQAIQFSEHGDRDVIDYDGYADPEPDRDEVMVDVKAAALNHLDVFSWMGLGALSQLDHDFPHISGSDAAGVVTEVGADVARFEPGNRVAVSAGVACETCEFCRDGEETLCVDYHLLGEHVLSVHSEFTAVPERQLVPVSDGVD